MRVSLRVLKVEVKEESHELLISGRKCALTKIVRASMDFWLFGETTEMMVADGVPRCSL